MLGIRRVARVGVRLERGFFLLLIMTFSWARKAVWAM